MRSITDSSQYVKLTESISAAQSSESKIMQFGFGIGGLLVLGCLFYFGKNYLKYILPPLILIALIVMAYYIKNKNTLYASIAGGLSAIMIGGEIYVLKNGDKTNLKSAE